MSTYNLQCHPISKSQCLSGGQTVNTELFKGTAGARIFCADCLAAIVRAVRVNSSDLEAKIRNGKKVGGLT